MSTYLKNYLNYCLKNTNLCFTHDGEFHADDVFSTALIKLYCRKKELTEPLIVRSRSIPDLFGGLIYDENNSPFDHHEELKYRVNGVPYAAFGLLWQAVGDEFVSEPEKFDSSFVIFIDANDNGISGYNDTYSRIISSMNPTWEEDVSEDEQFEKAVQLAISILEREFAVINARNNAIPFVQKAYENSKNKEIVVLERFAMWQKALVPTDAKFVIWQKKGKFLAQAIPVEVGSFELKTPFKEEWAGLRNEDLRKVSGLNLNFCHKNLFFIEAETLESAIKACEISLRRKNNES